MTTPILLHTDHLTWVPLSAGISFKPLAFYDGDRGYQLLLRVEPGVVVPRHRHTGEVHAFVVSGRRKIAGLAEELGPGTYVHEPIGNVDSWAALGQPGDEPCIIHIETTGRIEYLDAQGGVTRYTDASTARRAYLDWCAAAGEAPHPALSMQMDEARVS